MAYLVNEFMDEDNCETHGASSQPIIFVRPRCDDVGSRQLMFRAKKCRRTDDGTGIRVASKSSPDEHRILSPDAPSIVRIRAQIGSSTC
jgi:hypothetical protein